MDIRVHSKNMTVSEELREVAELKVEHAGRVFDNVGAADVEFIEEQNPRISDGRYRVEITAPAAGQVVRVEAAGFDDRAALDNAVDKFERRLRRLKERIIARSRKAKEKGLNHALPRVDEQSEKAGIRIERVKQFVVKPMMPEEAALQMEMLDHSFFFFFNAETERYSVLYRRRGGSLGLIEPS
ncbi:MAG: ribosome hibernation-promoting factor, HPF/YfiA family [Acidimicrobiia bacterium]